MAQEQDRHPNTDENGWIKDEALIRLKEMLTPAASPKDRWAGFGTTFPLGEASGFIEAKRGGRLTLSVSLEETSLLARRDDGGVHVEAKGVILDIYSSGEVHLRPKSQEAAEVSDESDPEPEKKAPRMGLFGPIEEEEEEAKDPITVFGEVKTSPKEVPMTGRRGRIDGFVMTGTLGKLDPFAPDAQSYTVLVAKNGVKTPVVKPGNFVQVAGDLEEMTHPTGRDGSGEPLIERRIWASQVKKLR